MPTSSPLEIDFSCNISFTAIFDGSEKNTVMSMPNHALTSNSEYDRVKQLGKI